MRFVVETVQGTSAIDRKVANRWNATDAVLGKEDDRIVRTHPGDRCMGVLAEDRAALGNVNRLKSCCCRCFLMKGQRSSKERRHLVVPLKGHQG